MIEALVTAVIACIAGGAALNNRLHNKIENGISELDRRISGLDQHIDDIELKLAQKYVSKTDLTPVVSRIEDHILRIENKLDQIVLKNN